MLIKFDLAAKQVELYCTENVAKCFSESSGKRR